MRETALRSASQEVIEKDDITDGGRGKESCCLTTPFPYEVCSMVTAESDGVRTVVALERGGLPSKTTLKGDWSSDRTHAAFRKSMRSSRERAQLRVWLYFNLFLIFLSFS